MMELSYKQLKQIKMKVVKANLDGSTPEVDPNAVYLVDFSKIDSVESLMLILASIGFSFSPKHPHFDRIKEFLNLENPISIQQAVNPKDTEIKLPKLKPIRPNGE